MTERRARRVLLVGWDAADWKVIHPLLDGGRMPTLRRLVEEGASGELETLDPPVSPMLWTSVATGKTADEHGILSFFESDPENQRIRPILSTSRRVKALWNILTQEGLRSVVVGWWPSHPAEPILGGMVSNLYHHEQDRPADEWPLPEQTVHPPELAARMAELRVHPHELTAAHLLPFVPRAAEVDQRRDRGLLAVSRLLAHASSIQAAATELMEHQEWDLAAVYFDAIDHFSHVFMRFHPPAHPLAPPALAEIYRDVVASAYRFHDMLLERLLALAGPETLVLLVSDHGFHSDRLRPLRLPRTPTAPLLEHRRHGIVCLHGPGVEPDSLVLGANLLDIAPTVLWALGLPVGEDMPGRVLLDAFVDPPPVATVPSWEEIEGECGAHREEARRDPAAEWAAHRQLVELGYVAPGAEDDTEKIVRNLAESRYFLARVHHSRGRPDRAVEVLEALVAEHPERRYWRALMRALWAAGRRDEFRSRLDERDDVASGKVVEAVFRSWLELAEGDTAAAIRRLEEAEADRPGARWILRELVRALLAGDTAEEAEGICDLLVEEDPSDFVAYRLRAEARSARENWRGAVDDLLASLALRFSQPEVHADLAAALLRSGEVDRAEQALRIAVRMDPDHLPTHRLGWELFSEHRPDPDRAAEHAAALERLASPAPGT